MRGDGELPACTLQVRSVGRVALFSTSRGVPSLDYLGPFRGSGCRRLARAAQYPAERS